jgi:5'-nucleotidase
MNTLKPRILLTNDDSIDSPGLWAAAEGLAKLGYVEVVAPTVQQTAMGRSHPREYDRVITRQTLNVHGKDWTVWAVNGSPAQAVLHGIYQVMGGKPDLVVSGINYGENIASGITISGTVGAALEAASLGIKALAISLEAPISAHYNLSREIDFSVAGYFCGYFAEKLLNRDLPDDIDVLKVDVPAGATPETEWVITRQSKQRYYFHIDSQPDPLTGVLPLRYEARMDLSAPEPNSDLQVLINEHKVSVTPISLDLTSRVDFAELRKLLDRN